MSKSRVEWALARAATVLLFIDGAAAGVPRDTLIPQIEGPWWPVAGNPMDHKHATAKQEPVDFAVWQAADGSWQLWSCIRATTAGGQGGKTRFFYRWEGRNLTDPTLFGINQDPKYFLCTLPVAAPEIILHEGRYYIAALNEALWTASESPD